MKKSISKKPSQKSVAKQSDPIIQGVKITHPSRIMGPTKTVSKLEIVQYYEKIAPYILPHLIDRPLSIVRCPSGQPKCFFQKHRTEAFPKEVYKINVNLPGEKIEEYIMIKNIKGLISLIQFGTLEIHPWGSHKNNLEKPDRITFDLDPDPTLPWKKIIEAALLLRKELLNLKLRSFIKTSGGKGLHLVIPIKPKLGWNAIKSFTYGVVLRMAEKYPERFTATVSKPKRKGKIFIDYLRNTRGATSVGAYSTRAREGAPISLPIRWQELARIRSGHEFDVLNISKRMAKIKRDPWKGFFSCRQTISVKLLKKLS